MDKRTLIRNFSKHASTYDRYADIQQMTARELIRRLPKNDLKNILEIGCGTGNYTGLLKNKYKAAGLTAIDISPEMIEAARRKLRDNPVTFIAGDAEEVFPDERFDLITSNAAFQWLENLDWTVQKYRHMLAANGLVLFSTFGPGTFRELAYSLAEVLKNDCLINASSFLGKDKLTSILAKYFSDVETEEWVIKERHDSLLGLLTKIKYTGEIGHNRVKLLWKRSLIKKAEDIYKAHFGGIETSYQIFICRAKI